MSSCVIASVVTPSFASVACVARSDGVQSGTNCRRPVSIMSGTPNSSCRARQAVKARSAERE